MLRKIQELSLGQKKFIVGTAAVVLGVLMFQWHIPIWRGKGEEADFSTLFPQEEREAFFSEFSERRAEFGGMKEAMEGTGIEAIKMMDLDKEEEEEILRFLRDWGMFSEEEFSEIEEKGGLENLEEEEIKELLERTLEEDETKGETKEENIPEELPEAMEGAEEKTDIKENQNGQ